MILKTKSTDFGLLILRISVAGLMLIHGIFKILNGIGFIKEMAGSMAYGVYIGEVLAPIAIIIGFRTRIASAILAFNCLVALLMVHAKDLLALNSYGGYANELLFLYMFGAAALMFSGAGKYAVSRKSLWD